MSIEMYNLFGIVVFAAAIGICLFVKRGEQAVAGKRQFDITFLEKPKMEIAIVGLIVLTALLLRVLYLGSIPSGFNVDEASIGYDAWALGKYGIDRNGYIFPVYPVAWGTGHGPLYLYIVLPFIKLFGASEFVYRLPVALLGTLTVLIFYFAIKAMWGKKTAYLGAALLCISPWHIMMSRWGLDSNPIPFAMMMAVFVFIMAVKNQKTGLFILSSALFAVVPYSYGSANVVVPITIIGIYLYALAFKKVTIKQLLLSVVSFCIIILPLGTFYVINFFDLPEIITPFFTVPKLNVMRSQSVFLTDEGNYLKAIVKNTLTLVQMLTVGKEDLPWNVIPGYAIMFGFTFPVTLAGFVICIKKLFRKVFSYDAIMTIWFMASCVLAVLIKQNINRLSIMFIPVIYFLVIGLKWVYTKYKILLPILMMCIGIASVSFIYTYFTQFGEIISPYFLEGYGEAVEYADELEVNHIYVTKDMTNPSDMNTAFYAKTDPKQFNDTVVYNNLNGEIRSIEFFDKWILKLPDDVTSEEYYEDAFIVSADETKLFSDDYEFVYFDNFVVVTH